MSNAELLLKISTPLHFTTPTHHTKPQEELTGHASGELAQLVGADTGLVIDNLLNLLVLAIDIALVL